MSEPIWDGVTRAETLGSATERQHLADRARAYDWLSVLEIMSRHPELINSTRPGGHSLYTVLHQAAHGGALVSVVERLLALGAWQTLRNAKGERAVDIARRCGHAHLAEVLEPVLRHSVPSDELEQMQEHFHSVIRGRVDDLVREHALRLPELEPLLEMPEPKL
ncbi:MAG: ankyrin repeat domain-containing protein [Chloroflexota bacterium]|nr:ankyrin repeat domain-containing protein [Chloroflexota bacterium]